MARNYSCSWQDFVSDWHNFSSFALFFIAASFLFIFILPKIEA
jgi:hypothetical protein